MTIPERINLKKNLAIPFFFIILFLAACSDSPNSLGQDVIDKDFKGDIINLKEFDTFDIDLIQEFTSYNVDTTIDYSATDRVLLGNLDGVKFESLLRFDFQPDANLIADFLANKVSIIQASVKLNMDYFIGSADKKIDFDVKQILNDWNLTKFNLDSLKKIRTGDANLISALMVKEKTVSFDLDHSVIKEWFKDKDKNYGLFLTPNQNCNTVFGFLGKSELIESEAAQLTIIYKRDKIDTLKVSTAADLFVPVKKEYIKPAGKIVAQGIIPLRSNYKFNAQQLPQRIAINKAEIEFSLDESESYFNRLAADSLKFEIFTDDTKKNVSQNYWGYAYVGKRENNKYRGNITEPLQYLLNNPEKNYGFRVSLVNETNSMSKIVLYSSDITDKTKKPKIKIYYTQK